MVFVPQLSRILEKLGEEKPRSYYVFLAVIFAWLFWSTLQGLLVWQVFTGENVRSAVIATLFFFLAVPKLVLINYYAKMSEAAVDFLNISMAAEALLYI